MPASALRREHLVEPVREGRQPDPILPAQGHVAERRGQIRGEPELVPGSEVHGLARVQEQMHGKIGFRPELAQEQFPQAGVDVPVHIADVVAAVVLPVVGEVDAAAGSRSATPADAGDPAWGSGHELQPVERVCMVPEEFPRTSRHGASGHEGRIFARISPTRSSVVTFATSPSKLSRSRWRSDGRAMARRSSSDTL